MNQKTFRKVLADWIGEVYFQSSNRLSDGTPNMGKFEAEELYRQGKKFLETEEVDPKFGGLTNAQRERLEMLAEEAAEVVQACTKILRHGYYSYNPNDSGKISNKSLLEMELLQFWTIYEQMALHEDLVRINFFGTAKVWEKKLPYTHHQEVPTVEDPK